MKAKIILLCLVLTGAAIAAFVSLSPRDVTAVAEPSTKEVMVNDVLPDHHPDPVIEDISSPSEVVQPDGGMKDEFISTLATYPGFGHDIDKDEALYSKEEKQREGIIAGCMRSNGFEYTPAPSVLIDDEVMADPEAFEALLNEMAVDPNETYVLSLPEAQQRSYYLALYGMENPNEQEADAHDQALNADNCTAQAFAEVPGVYAKRNLLSEQLDEMESRIQADEALQIAYGQWSQCMQQQGYRFSKPADVDKQADELMAVLYEGVDPLEVLPVQEIDPVLYAVVSDSSMDQEAKIQQVTASLDMIDNQVNACDKKTGLSEEQLRIRVQHENAFVQQYKTTLNK